MNPKPQRLVIATRESRLALWQAEHVAQQLRRLYPECDIRLLGMSTRGDRILDRPLASLGGKGLFIKELENALADGRADLAVHSMKDVPMALPAGFALAAVSARANPLDAFVSARYAALEELPPGAVVGTSSLRREAQLHAHCPYLAVAPLRGNLDTRLKKLDAGEYDAIIVAAAGLGRLGLDARIRQELPAALSLPAAGQGALGIETLSVRTDVQAWLQPLHDAASAHCITAERALAGALAGSCSVPLAAYAEMRGTRIWLRARIGLPDGSRLLDAEGEAAPEAAAELGQAVAAKLRRQGADEILALLSA